MTTIDRVAPLVAGVVVAALLVAAAVYAAVEVRAMLEGVAL